MRDFNDPLVEIEYLKEQNDDLADRLRLRDDELLRLKKFLMANDIDFSEE